MKINNTLQSLLLIAFFLSAFFLITSFQSQPMGNLTAKVTRIRNSNGEINFNLFNNADGFPKEEVKAFKHLRGKISNGTSTVTFENIPFGKYAVAVYHDENNNKKLDKNFFGMPTEGVAVSNDAKGSISGPPSFDAAKFDFNAQSQNIVITMNYSFSH
jgi:uncharacterized protein (DUF2141 family)